MANDKKNKGGADKTSKRVLSIRRESVRVKARKNLTESSRRWLQRHLNDPYVAASKEDGYRSRAAYKLLQLDEKFHLLRSPMRVIDLGAAPGGWTQVVAQKCGTDAKKGSKIIGLDILPVEPLPDVTFLQMDFLTDEAPIILKKHLDGQADLVLSDMAPSTTGHSRTDHIRVMAMAELAASFAIEVLRPGGAFVCKIFQGGAEKELLTLLKTNFAKVRHAKPAASRAESSESYIVAEGFRSTP